MADNKTYYYMRLKEHFFDSDEIIILENMPNGYVYSNILLKLYLKSLKRSGKLMLSDTIPYNADILAKVTRHDIKTIKQSLDIFKELGLIEIIENGAIYMTNIQSYIGKSSTEADRKRVYREQIEQDKFVDMHTIKCPDITSDIIEDKVQYKIQDVSQDIGKDITKDKCPDKSIPEIEIETELESDTDLEKEDPSFCNECNKFLPGSLEMLCVETIIHSCLELYPNSKVPITYMEKEKWAFDIDKMGRLDNRTEDEIKQALQFAITDSFWKPNIRSAKKFREKFETLLIQSKQRKDSSTKQTTEDFCNMGKEWLNERTAISSDIINY
jgi:predicted phage replisome organizer